MFRWEALLKGSMYSACPHTIARVITPWSSECQQNHAQVDRMGFTCIFVWGTISSQWDLSTLGYACTVR